MGSDCTRPYHASTMFCSDPSTNNQVMNPEVHAKQWVLTLSPILAFLSIMRWDTPRYLSLAAISSPVCPAPIMITVGSPSTRSTSWRRLSAQVPCSAVCRRRGPTYIREISSIAFYVVSAEYLLGEVVEGVQGCIECVRLPFRTRCGD